MLQIIFLFFSFTSELLEVFSSLEWNMEHTHYQGIQGSTQSLVPLD